MHFISKFSSNLNGKINIPGDKSISHRAIILGSIANGTTTINGFLTGEDALATLQVFIDMGVDIQQNNDRVIINGVGLNGLKPANKVLNLGNSGTSVRLISGILIGQTFNTKIIGDESLSARPMGRIITPLSQMGAKINSNNNMLPLNITGVKNLNSISYTMPIASAQVKSSILLAGLYAKGRTCIIENIATRNHTEKMLASFGADLDINGNKICLKPKELIATNITVPSDISSAAFFIVAATIAENADVTLTQVNINPTRAGIIDILKLMGARLAFSNKNNINGELVADINIKSAKLTAINIPHHLISLAIDEFPAIFIAMSCADGESILTGAKELRVKESDRITAMATGLSILGINNTVLADGIKITGSKFSQPITALESYNDHRIAMAFAIASCACKYTIKINNTSNVATSFPNFIDTASKIGLNINSYNS